MKEEYQKIIAEKAHFIFFQQEDSHI